MCLLTAQADDCHVHDKNANDILHAVRKSCLKEDRLLGTVYVSKSFITTVCQPGALPCGTRIIKRSIRLKLATIENAGLGKWTEISLIPREGHMLDWKHSVIKWAQWFQFKVGSDAPEKTKSWVCSIYMKTQAHMHGRRKHKWRYIWGTTCCILVKLISASVAIAICFSLFDIR